MIVTALTPENHPLLQTVLRILLTVGAHLHHLVLTESLLLGQTHHGSQVLLLLTLSVQHVAVPFSYFLNDALVAQLVQIQAIVTESLPIVKFLLVTQASQVELHAHFRDDLVIELRPHPHAKLGPGWQDTESLRDVPNCPSLQVQFVDSVNCSG